MLTTISQWDFILSSRQQGLDMSNKSYVSRSVAEVVDHFVSSRGRGSIVSTRDAVGAVRYAEPRCEHTDQELAAIVASAAIIRGHAVAFDHGERELGNAAMPSGACWARAR
jgi:hypothetical protein